MNIVKAVSYKNAWNLLKDSDDFLILKDFLNTYCEIENKFREREEIYSNGSSVIASHHILTSTMQRKRWNFYYQESDFRKTSYRHRSIAISPSNKLMCYIQTSSMNLMSCIYNSFLKAKENIVSNHKIPIFITIPRKYSSINSYSQSIEIQMKEIIELNPNLDFPILYLYVDNNDNDLEQNIETNVTELKINHNTLERCITFEPEYYQAGLSILNYFGSVLNEKYPEENATVKISQNGFNVKMTVETATGNKEVIEQALHEYELVFKGETPPKNFYNNPIKVLELKNQLRVTQVLVESQRDTIALQNGMIRDMKDIATQALISSSQPIHIHNQLSNVQNTTINYKNEINKTYDVLEDLIDLTDSESLKNRLSQIQNALENAKNSDDPEEVKESGGMKKLSKFLNEAKETGTQANELVEKGGEILEKIKSLGRGYNAIAEWCALPVIPTVFVKEKEVSKDE